MSLPRIFVQIPAYRDRECQWTLRDMFERARYPERVFAGVCWQTIPEEDADCFLIRPRPDQVRAITFHASEARGLGWARAHAQSLWDGEEFVLQIDSHMRFADDWDARMIAALEACRVPDPVLTVYPPGYTPPDRRDTVGAGAVQIIKGFLPNGLLDFTAAQVPQGVVVEAPMPTSALAGGFIFGGARIIRDVPSDPEIYFNGEEPDLAVRLWTSGFDLFSPHEPLIYHYYLRKDGARHWNDAVPAATRELQTRTLHRMRLLCEPTAFTQEEVASLGRFGLGTARSLAEYEAFSGVNFAARSVAAWSQTWPFVRQASPRRAAVGSPDVTAAAAVSVPGSLRPAPGTELFVLGDEGVLFNEAKGTLHRLNEAATFAWCAREAGQDWATIARGAASGRGIPYDLALAELRDLTEHWLAEGMLTDATATSLSAPRLDSGQFDFHVHDYRLLDSLIRIRMGDDALAELIRPPFAHLEWPHEAVAPAATLTVVRILDWHYIFDGDSLLHVGDDERKLVPELKAAALARAVARQSHILHLHSAAVMAAGRLLLLPGPSGGGKTVLTARLLALGCGYFSDETVLPRGHDGAVRPVPTSLSVKAGGVALLAPHYPGLAALPEHIRADGVAVRYLPPPPTSLLNGGEYARPELIVFPRHVAGAEASLRRIGPAEALGRLLAECIAIPRRLNASAAATIVATVENADCRELVTGDLDASAALLMTWAEGG
jgi:hypothetical protein